MLIRLLLTGQTELTGPEEPECLTVYGNFLALLRASLGSRKLISHLVCVFGARWQAEPARPPRERAPGQRGSSAGIEPSRDGQWETRPGTALPPHREQPHAGAAHCHAVFSLSAPKVYRFLVAHPLKLRFVSIAG